MRRALAAMRRALAASNEDLSWAQGRQIVTVPESAS